MNADIGELLRESIDRFTKGATAPAGLAHRARRRHHHRRLAVHTALASGTTLVAAAAVLVATAGTGGIPHRQGNIHPGGNSIAQPVGGPAARTTAYVVSRMGRALAAAQRGRAIQEIHTVGHDAWFSLVMRSLPGGVLPPQTSAPLRAGLEPGLFTTRLITWVYQGQLRQQGFTAAGHVLFDAQSTTVNSHRGAPPGLFTQTIRYRGADFRAGTWWHNIYRPAGYFGYGGLPSSCRYLGGGLEPPVPVQYNPYDWSAAIRLDLQCGHYDLGGRQRVDGVETIKLVARTPQTGPFAKHKVPVLETLWVDASTYLPMRVLWQWPEAHGQPDGTLVSDFRWLAPTKANLATLRVKIPHGFREVTLATGLPRFEFEISGQSSW